MRKLFGRKVQQPVQVQPQQHTKQPIDGPPSPSQQYPYPATQPRSQADHWQPIQERSDSFASSYQSSQPPLSQPATPSTAPTRSSFQLQSQQQQQQQKHFVASSRQSSQEDPSPLGGEQNWVVVDQPQTNLGGGGIDAGRFVRAQPSFESRSSSIASLPAGASPPIQYPTPNPQQSPISPFGVNPAPPPSQVSSPLGRQNTTTRRLIPSRKLSADSHTPRTTRQPVNPLRNISSSTEEFSMMSQTPSQDTHKDKPKRGFLDWLAGDKEKIARAHHATERSLSPDPVGQNWGLTKLMGFMTATASEDWTLLMEVCEQASTEAGAKEAAKALKYEIKYAEAPAMLSAARLWAIMLRNTQPPFVQATSTKKFLDVVEDALNNPETSPVVRDRLMFVLAGASAQFGNKYPNLRSSWKKVKPREAPVEGIPFDPKDPMFQPPSRRLPKPGFVADPNQQQRPISTIEILPAPQSQSQVSLQSSRNHPLPPVPVPNAQHPVVLQGVDVHLYPEEPQQRREREYSNGGAVVALDSPQVITQREKKPKNRNRLSKMIISPEEDIRRLFQECEIAKSNAGLLTNAMTYAKPEEVVAGGADGLIREFYLKCMHSQEIITAQIPWATAQSERARATFLQAHPEAADNPEAHTVEEELLSEILLAHQELLEAFRVYDENEKLAMQEREIREVQERSKVETRLDRTQIQYYAADGSFMTQPAGGAGGSGSRSPSPVPPVIQGDHPQARSSPGPRAGHPLPTPPPNVGLGVPNAYDSHHPNGSNHTLAPPPHAPHGPRHPRSRSPSPDGQSRKSVDLPRSTTATPGISGAATPNGASAAGGRLDTLRRGMSKLGLDVKRTRSGSSASASGRGRKSAEVANGVPGQPHDDDDDEIRTPIQPSAKALGKRRADPAPEEAFDPDDIFKERTATPMGGYPPAEDALLNSDSDSADDGANGHIEYAYDAAAERKKELEREAKKAARLRSSVPST